MAWFEYLAKNPLSNSSASASVEEALAPVVVSGVVVGI